MLRLGELLNGDQSISKDSDRDLFEHRLTVGLLTTNSPYAEVRAVVDPTDDPSMPSSTLRAWVIGLVFVVLVSFVNQLFSVRQPSIRLAAPVVQLLSYPVGKAAERWLPDKKFKLFGTQHSLNPGVFNQKEHMLISIMAAVGTGLPYSRYISKQTKVQSMCHYSTNTTANFCVCQYSRNGSINTSARRMLGTSGIRFSLPWR